MRLATRTKLQRLCLFVFVCAGVGRFYYDSLYYSFSPRYGGADMQFSPDSDPWVFAWVLCVIPVFVLLMRYMPDLPAQGTPRTLRRAAAGLIDLVFSLTAISGVCGLVLLWFAYRRTGHVFWQFNQTTGEEVADLQTALFSVFVLILMFLMVCSVAYPLTRGKQTVGGFIMRVRLTSPFAHNGKLPFDLALRRTYYEVRWASLFNLLFSLANDPDRVRAQAPAVLVGDE